MRMENVTDGEKIYRGPGSDAAAARAWPRAGKLLLLGLLLAAVTTAGACKDKSKEARERAMKEITDSLVVPPNSTLRDTKVSETDILIVNYGTNEPYDAMGEFFRNAVRTKGYQIASEGEGNLSYQDKAGRQVTIMWFARDPDLSEFKTVIHYGIQPLPPELKEPAAEKENK